MTKCYLCEKETVENWFGTYCTNCRKIKNLGNVYGFDRIYGILENCCIRDPTQLEAKILKQKKKEVRYADVVKSNVTADVVNYKKVGL